MDGFLTTVVTTVHDHVTAGGLLTAVYIAVCAVAIAGVVTTIALDRVTRPRTSRRPAGRPSSTPTARSGRWWS